MFTNEFCLQRRGNHYLNFPYSDRIIDVYGPTSKIYFAPGMYINLVDALVGWGLAGLYLGKVLKNS